MSFYGDLQGTAARLIKQFGQPLTFNGPDEEGTFDPATGETTNGFPVTVTFNGLTLDYDNSQIDGELIRRGDVKVIAEVGERRPETGWTFEAKGKTYSVLQSAPLSPAGVDVIWEIQGRA